MIVNLQRDYFCDRQTDHTASCKERSATSQLSYSAIWNYWNCNVQASWIHLQVWPICQSCLLGFEQKRISSFYDNIITPRWFYFVAYPSYRKGVSSQKLLASDQGTRDSATGLSVVRTSYTLNDDTMNRTVDKRTSKTSSWCWKRSHTKAKDADRWPIWWRTSKLD